jgi:hypothetical protein
MKFEPLKRAETPLHAVAATPQRKAANGRVVRRGGVRTIIKHAPYAKAKLSAPVLKNYLLPVNGYGDR